VAKRIRTLENVQRALVMVVRRIAIPRTHERLTGRAGVDIDRVEAIALSRIVDAGSMTVTALAEQLGVACSTAGRHGANLEVRGLVTRSPDIDDRRVTVVTATAAGAGLIDHLRETQRDLLEEVLSDWTNEALEELASLLERLGEDLAVLTESSEVEA
jgi:DNA-binding MarR family transcriptional regulator